MSNAGLALSRRGLDSGGTIALCVPRDLFLSQAVQHARLVQEMPTARKDLEQ